MKKPLALLALLLALSSCKEMGSTDSGQKPEPAAGILVDAGYQQLAQQRPDMALVNFSNALKADDKNIRALQGKGLALNDLGRHAEADQAYGKALLADVTSVGVRNNLAMSKILQGKYEEAAGMLEPLAKSHPGNDTVQQNLALAHCLMGKRDDARQIYSRTLSPAEIEDNLRFCSKYETVRKKK